MPELPFHMCSVFEKVADQSIELGEVFCFIEQDSCSRREWLSTLISILFNLTKTQSKELSQAAEWNESI